MTVRTYHVYKTNCFGASRLSLQASWDDDSVFIHKSDVTGHVAFGGKQVESHRLSLPTLLRAIRHCRRDERSSFVFHAQSSLPYLFFFAAAAWVTNSLHRISLVYDVHDLHEAPLRCDSLRQTVSGHIRHVVLGALEALAIRHGRVSIMTVSDGLRRIMSKRYGRECIEVVRSAPRPPHDADALAAAPRIPETILFFGSKDRVPVDIFDKIGVAGMNIHIYGRELTKSWFESHSGRVTPDHVQFMGGYVPDSLEFVMSYELTVIYVPDSQSDNFIYSLPNKFFQSLCLGSAVIVSKNAVEMPDVMASVPGSVLRLSPEMLDNLGEVIADFQKKARAETFWRDLVSRMHDLHAGARVTYRAVTGLRVQDSGIFEG